MECPIEQSTASYKHPERRSSPRSATVVCSAACSFPPCSSDPWGDDRSTQSMFPLELHHAGGRQPFLLRRQFAPDRVQVLHRAVGQEVLPPLLIGHPYS